MQAQTESLVERVQTLVQESRKPLMSTASTSAAIAELHARIETLERAMQEIAEAGGVATSRHEA
jgi:hypothetical protein